MTDGTPPKVEPPDLLGMIRRALAKQSGPGAAPITCAVPVDMRRYTLDASRSPRPLPPELVARVPLAPPRMEVLGVEPAFPGLDVQMRDIQHRVIHASVMNDEMDCMRRVLAYLIKGAGGQVTIPVDAINDLSPNDLSKLELRFDRGIGGDIHIAVVPRPAAPVPPDDKKGEP